MEAGASSSSLGTKTQQLSEGQDASQDTDVISKLPDEILVGILSLLSTKESIRTSVLSKRWKYLWVLVPNFDFGSYSFNWHRSEELQASFLNSIERALLHRNTSCLGCFKLYLDMPVNASRVSLWVSASIKHEVRELSLRLIAQRELLLPSSLFTSTSLSSLSLSTSGTSKVPSFICFSGLEELRLSCIVFQDDQSVQQLFSGCPVLKKLGFHDCRWRNIKEATIEIPSLRALIYAKAPNYSSLYVPLKGKIIISALNLEALEVRGSLDIEVSLCNLLSLKSACIDTYRWCGEEEKISRIVTLLSGLHSVKSLHVSSETLEPLHHAENVEGLLPVFHNLIEYHVFSEYNSALVYILQKAPNLEVLDLPGGLKSNEDMEMALGNIPGCFHTSLKSFILHNVNGDEKDLNLLEHVWRNSPFLQRVTIKCSRRLSNDLGKQQEICQQLRQIQGAADTCLIEFTSPVPMHYGGIRKFYNPLVKIRG